MTSKNQNISTLSPSSEAFLATDAMSRASHSIAQRRAVQEKINRIADEMGVSENEKQKLLLSQYAYQQLAGKIQKKQQNDYGFGENMTREAIEEFVKQKTEENVSISSENSGQKKNSQKSGKSGTMVRNQKTRKSSKKKGGGAGKAIAWGLGGAMAGGFFFT